MSIYALYEGDRSICDGTIYQIAEVTGLKPATLKWYGTPSAQRKGNMALIKIEEYDDMFIGSNQPRSKRSFEGRAPIPSNYKTDDTAPVKTIYRPVQHKAWKPGKYTADLFHACFKNW